MKNYTLSFFVKWSDDDVDKLKIGKKILRFFFFNFQS